MDRGAWWVTVYRVTKSWTHLTEQLKKKKGKEKKMLYSLVLCYIA